MTEDEIKVANLKEQIISLRTDLQVANEQTTAALKERDKVLKENVEIIDTLENNISKLKSTLDKTNDALFFANKHLQETNEELEKSQRQIEINREIEQNYIQTLYGIQHTIKEQSEIRSKEAEKLTAYLDQNNALLLNAKVELDTVKEEINTNQLQLKNLIDAVSAKRIELDKINKEYSETIRSQNAEYQRLNDEIKNIKESLRMPHYLLDKREEELNMREQNLAVYAHRVREEYAKFYPNENFII